MILELRTYDFAPGDALRYLDIFAPEGLPLITRHLPLAGYWLSEVGVLNRLRHMWVYSSLEERTEKRAQFMADTEWTQGFLPRGMALIQRQATQLIVPDTISDHTQSVLKNATKPHEAHSGAHLRNDWAALSTVPLDGALFAGTVVAGEDVGSTLSIFPSAAMPSLELMRPCAFSPL
ncbi:NIPSNAP family protein [Labrenzia sp. PHM005]|uniref:NIPSNAP family protein n=1 Tax=Labrenzia sp. PHM005 TaxID=2590016 RepID=UPI00143DF15A|nr:NIPSNAP family protein [Labrenzia sp. PHM005]